MNIYLVLNYNDWQETERIVKDTIQFKNIDKIVIVDNFSTDISYEKLSKLCSDKVELIRTEKNDGYARGNNFGLRYIDEKYKANNIIISNPDIIVTEDMLNLLIDQFNRDKNDGVVLATGKVKNKKGEYEKNCWKLPNYSKVLLSCIPYVWSKYAVKNYWYSENELEKNKYLVDVATGCFFICDFEAIKKVNYFDDETFLYGEEIMLAYKIREHGMKVKIYKNIEVIHFHGKIINKHFKSTISRFLLMMDSRRIYIKKYLKVNKVKEKIFELFLAIGILQLKIVHFVKRNKYEC